MTNENNNEFLPEEEEVVETIEETEELMEEAEETVEEPEETVSEEVTEEKEEKSTLREALEWVLCIGVAVALALLIRNFVFTFVRVDGNSMLPNLHHQDHLIVSRMAYEPERGDIVVFHPRFMPKTAYVKRVIAVEGETVFIDYETSTVYVNGEPLEEDYIDQIMEYRGPDGEVTVPEDCVFVLGDNRNNSRDSRFADVGFVTEESILGKATFRVWPLNAFGVID